MAKTQFLFFQEYVSNHLISLLYNFHFIFRRRYLIIKKTILKVCPPKFMILNVVFALKLSNYQWLYIVEMFYMSQMNPKEFVHNTAYSV